MKDIDIQIIIDIALEAGKEIMTVYDQDFSVELKGDNSPLTLADQKSNGIIVKALKENYPDIPVISEETKLTPYEERKDWKMYWLVDPLDGTKEFIKKNGEFTVNIALMSDGRPGSSFSRNWPKYFTPSLFRRSDRHSTPAIHSISGSSAFSSTSF